MSDQYIILKPGETIQAGDEARMMAGIDREWHRVTKRVAQIIGPVDEATIEYRRKVIDDIK